MYSCLNRQLMTPLQKGRLVIDGDRTAGTRDCGIGGSWFLRIFCTGPLGKNHFCFILDGLKSCLPSLRSPSQALSLVTSRPTSCMGTNMHIQLVNPPVSAAQEGSSCRGMDSKMSLGQCFNQLTFIAKDYAKITLNRTHELLKITNTKESSAVLAPLSLALDGVITCVDLYMVSSLASLKSILIYSIHREHLAIIKK